MVGKPTSELGRDQETRHDRPSARSAQVCGPTGPLQGTSHFIRHRKFITLISNEALLISVSLTMFTGGTGEESDLLAIHDSHSDDACRWNHLAGA